MPTKYIKRTCRKHGMTDYIFVKSGARYRCVKCRSEAVSRRRKKVKQKLLDHFGGSCTICGYNKCVRALTFHHVDPSKKEFGISWKGQTRSYEKAIKEAEKCILVCHNCHSEIHDGLHPEFLNVAG